MIIYTSNLRVENDDEEERNEKASRGDANDENFVIRRVGDVIE